MKRIFIQTLSNGQIKLNVMFQVITPAQWKCLLIIQIVCQFIKWNKKWQYVYIYICISFMPITSSHNRLGMYKTQLEFKLYSYDSYFSQYSTQSSICVYIFAYNIFALNIGRFVPCSLRVKLRTGKKRCEIYMHNPKCYTRYVVVWRCDVYNADCCPFILHVYTWRGASRADPIETSLPSVHICIIFISIKLCKQQMFYTYIYHILMWGNNANRF